MKLLQGEPVEEEKTEREKMAEFLTQDPFFVAPPPPTPPEVLAQLGLLVEKPHE